MKKIIMATDFSPVAQNAATYAVNLAKYLNYELELIHSYIVPFAYTDSPVPLLNIEELQTISENSMEAELTRLNGLKYGIKISQQVLVGDIYEVLKEIMEEDPPSLLIVGSTGDRSDSILWGSMAVKLLRNIEIPVLAIPADTEWTPLKNICFAADDIHEQQETPIDQIKKWTSLMDASLHVVHIHEDEKPLKNIQFLEDNLKEIHPSFYKVVNKQVDEGIQTFLQIHQMDWLIVVPRKYGFFESLFHTSKTKAITKISGIPVLSLKQF